MSAAHVYSCSPVVDNGDLDDLDDRDDGEDKAHCACAVFGVFNCPAAASSTVYYGLHALQHRGQECAGIASLQWDAARGRHRAQIKKDFGLVLDVFNDQTLFTTLLTGSAAVGHTRYSTSGSDASPHNIQPFMVNYKHGNLMLAHNGNVSNAATLRRTQIDDKGVLFQSTSDSELVLHLMAQSSKRTPTEQLLDALQQLEGAFSFIILTDECMYGVRDPNGFRPLCLGRLDVADKDGNGPAYCLASETCAFDLIGATYVRDVEPGEVVKITTAGCRGGGAFESFRVPARFAPVSPCIFEYVYFSRPDSMVFGQLVDTVRHRTGEHLAFEHPVPRVAPNEPPVTIVPVPDSANIAALGYAQACQAMGLNCQYSIGLIRNHYVGRTFISPNQSARELKVRCKFNPVRRVLTDRIVVLVDDSIVRGTTSKQLVKMVRDAGAREVHFRVASPPVISPCFYGMDFPSRQELLANNFAGRGADAASRAAMAAWLGADSLEYLSADGLLACAGMDQMKMTLPNARDAIRAANASSSTTAMATTSAPVLESSASAASSARAAPATVKKLEIRIDGDESTSSSASSSFAVPPKPHIPSWCTACFSDVYPVPIAELITPIAGCASKDW